MSLVRPHGVSHPQQTLYCVYGRNGNEKLLVGEKKFHSRNKNHEKLLMNGELCPPSTARTKPLNDLICEGSTWSWTRKLWGRMGQRTALCRSNIKILSRGRRKKRPSVITQFVIRLNHVCKSNGNLPSLLVAASSSGFFSSFSSRWPLLGPSIGLAYTLSSTSFQHATLMTTQNEICNRKL